eukprot:scaffold75663_cov31-Tisochrysis_lutea.AAC.2
MLAVFHSVRGCPWAHRDHLRVRPGRCSKASCTCWKLAFAWPPLQLPRGDHLCCGLRVGTRAKGLKIQGSNTALPRQPVAALQHLTPPCSSSMFSRAFPVVSRGGNAECSTAGFGTRGGCPPREPRAPVVKPPRYPPPHPALRFLLAEWPLTRFVFLSPNGQRSTIALCLCAPS